MSLCVQMDSSIPIHTSITTIILFFFFLTTLLPQSACHKDDLYWICSDKASNCGNLTNISHPFFGQNRPHFCGRASFECVDNQITIWVNWQSFTVLEINPMDHRITMVPESVLDQACPSDYAHTSLNPNLFMYAPTVHNVSIFYNCSPGFSNGGNHSSCGEDSEEKGFHGEWIQNCSGYIQVPAMQPIDLESARGIESLQEALEDGFNVQYNFSGCSECEKSGGVCGSWEYSAIFCYKPELDAASPHNNSYSSNWKKKIIIGVTTPAILTLLVCTLVGCLIYWNMKNNDKDIEAFVRNHGALTLKRYKFSDVKKMTNSFKVKLGQGGFGTVYKGKLVIGSPVAVKILNASKRNGEDFINEVASISKTSHVNVVTLLGFCFEGRKKALIYEFMANGSLDMFIHNKRDDGTSLSWEKLYQIAVGIARGLEYLHRGCRTQIFHFDIKPHNILLDENFCPKISDFGLAKLCPTRESIISMSEARGTLGYIAPEVWNRNFGGVSHKSDVYSYGMMLLEMVGRRKNINVEASHTSEIYFPDWIYKKLELGLRQDGMMTSEEDNTTKRMALVGLWCIQTIPSHRPTIGRVIEMLEGNLDSLEMPPKPVLSSPTRSKPESSIKSVLQTKSSLDLH